MIIDTHAHVAEACLLARTVAAVDRQYPILPVTDLVNEMDRHGVAKAVLVQWGESFDHHYLAYCTAAFPGRFAAVCQVDHRRDDACQTLRCLVEKHRFRGVRISTPDRSPGRDELALWKTAADLGVVVSASATSSGEFFDGLSGVLPHVPGLALRIEHLARPPYDHRSPRSAFDEVLRFAEYPHVYFNLDGFYSNHYPDHRRFTVFPFPEYQPFVRQALGAFGAERCMWGSEFPFLNNGYDVAVRFLREGCDFLSDAQREWVLGRTAAALWRLED